MDLLVFIQTIFPQIQQHSFSIPNSLVIKLISLIYCLAFFNDLLCNFDKFIVKGL